MRDKNLNSSQFCAQVENFIKRKLHLPKMPKTAVINTPTFLEECYFKYPRKYKEIRDLVVIHHFCPENLRWRLWLDLSELSFSQLNSKQRIEILILLSSKRKMLSYLFLTQRYSSHEIFGNIFGGGLKVLRTLPCYLSSTKITKPKRKRGYDDKGSQRPKDKWLPDFDFSLTELQNQKEKKTQLRQSIYYRILQILENYEREN